MLIVRVSGYMHQLDELKPNLIQSKYIYPKLIIIFWSMFIKLSEENNTINHDGIIVYTESMALDEYFCLDFSLWV